MPHVLSIRIDESLTYLNARRLEEYVLEEIADRPDVRHLILMCSVVNEIDAWARKPRSDQSPHDRRRHRPHLSEVKGPDGPLSGPVLWMNSTGRSSCRRTAFREFGEVDHLQNPFPMRGMI